MKPLLILALTGTVIITSACALFNRTTEQDPTPTFGYGLRGDTNIGVVQAFNLKGQTYIQFLDIERARPYFVSPTGQAINYKISGQYAVLPEKVDEVTVNTAFGRVLVYTLSRAPRTVLPEAAPIAASAPASAAVSALPSPQPVALRPELMSTTVTFGADQWKLDSLTVYQLKDLKRTTEVMKLFQDKEVRIVGYSDASGSPLYNLRLSERRADELAKVFRNAGFPKVVAIGRGPRDQVNDCTKVPNAILRERCLAVSRRVVIDVTL